MQKYLRLIQATFFVVVLLPTLLFITPAAYADTEKEAGKIGALPESSHLYQSLEKAIADEKEGQAELAQELARLEVFGKAILAEINAFKIQNSEQGNLLLSPRTSVKDLDKALAESKQTLGIINDRLKDLKRRRETVQALRQQTDEQIDINQRQKKEIESGHWPESEKLALLRSVNQLPRILAAKRKALFKLDNLQGRFIEHFSELSIETQALSQRMTQQIKVRTKQQLFERKYVRLKDLNIKTIKKEIQALGKSFAALVNKDFLSDQGLRVSEAGNTPLITLLLILGVAIVLFRRFHNLCRHGEEKPTFKEHPWRLLGLTLIRRSAYLFAAMLVVHVYNIVQFPQYKVPLFRLASQLVMVFLFSRWMLDFERLWKPKRKRQSFETVLPHIRFLINAIRYIAAVYLIILWAIGAGSLLLTALRLILETGLVAWCIVFWHRYRKAQAGEDTHQMPRVSFKETGVRTASYAVAIVGLVMEFAGYASIAVYWYVSCAKSIMVIFWAGISFMALRESRRDYRESIQSHDGKASELNRSLYLIFIQVAGLIWVILGIMGLLLAWSTNLEVLTTMHAILSTPFAIGKINLSILGLFYAGLIIFLTYILTGIGKYFLQEKVYIRGAVEPGLRVSVTSILIYLLWGLGLVMALSILGVSATSVAVVFGALSIGIGFGLQNIFNNFISGIILLVERPIQVGDDVEINGVWATVKKMNVRSTVVQTYDNASLIIPNSDFISSQVTNWSFKDKRLRRKVKVGVAYGSDVQLVRQTLLEIAAGAPHVLKYPKPDVLFSDFGDSALIFSLRVWTQIDYMFVVETHIRFEIDRLFREKDIVIAFPQRDVHIRTESKKADLDKEVLNKEKDLIKTGRTS